MVGFTASISHSRSSEPAKDFGAPVDATSVLLMLDGVEIDRDADVGRTDDLVVGARADVLTDTGWDVSERTDIGFNLHEITYYSDDASVSLDEHRVNDLTLILESYGDLDYYVPDSEEGILIEAGDVAVALEKKTTPSFGL